jgi:riboflavin synthase
MFTGLIAYLGTVYSAQRDPRGGMRLAVAAPGALSEGVEPKDSIAINGVCLTVVSRTSSAVTFDVVPETLVRSWLGHLRQGDPVNVELALRLNDRVGGHLVYGHVDGTAEILAKEGEGQGHRLTLRATPEIARFIVEKGYVVLDGVSLTVAAVREGRFEVALIPETSARTAFGSKKAGDVVNVEADPIARYVVACVQRYVVNAQPSGAAEDVLSVGEGVSSRPRG